MSGEVVIGIDMEGTWLRGSLVSKGKLVPRKPASDGSRTRNEPAIAFRPIDNKNSFGEIWDTLCDLIDEL